MQETKSLGKNSNNDNNVMNNAGNNVGKSANNYWLQLSSKRKCYIGPVEQRWIVKYNRYCLVLTMMSFDCTDASALRTVMFGKTRSGTNDKVRCMYNQEKRQWPQS